MYTGVRRLSPVFLGSSEFGKNRLIACETDSPTAGDDERSQTLRKLTTLLALVGAALLLIPGAAFAKGVSGPAIYVDGDVYRTVGTPTDFSQTGAPDHSFDVIYDIEGQLNVATAAPGDPGYNGGRWMVHALEVVDLEAADTNDSGDLDTAAEVEAAIAGGFAVDHGVVKYFECPVIKLPAKQR